MGRGSTLRIDIIADGSRASRTLDTVGGKVGTFAKRLAVGAAAGAAGVALAAGKIAVDSIKSASAVEQALGGVESVFGKYAGSVEKSARSAATSVGLATSEYADLATVLGAQLKNMGTSADQLAPKTDQLIKQGADLAATFGGTTADAVSAVSSLLKGERDPIERYGVSIKQADINARLAAQGQDKLTGAALASAQAQATLDLLTQQTTSAHGAFARESDTAAGQQQRLTAQWENAKAELGAGLLPIVTKAATFFVERVMPAVQGIASSLAKNLGPSISSTSSFVTGKLIPAAMQIYQWFMTRIAPGIRSAVTPVINGLRGAWDQVSSAIQRNRPQLDTIGRVLRTVAEFIANKVAPVVGKVLGYAFQLVGRNISTTIGAVSRLVDIIKSAIGWFQRLKDAASNIGSNIGGALSKLNPFGFATLSPTGPATSSTAPAGFASLALSPGLVAQPQTLTSGSSSPQTRPLELAPQVGPTTVNNYLTVNVDGALDPVAVAEQLRQVLIDQARRTGRPIIMAGA